MILLSHRLRKQDDQLRVRPREKMFEDLLIILRLSSVTEILK